jgi:hypothetical protein
MNKKSIYAFIHIQPIAKWSVHECCWVTLALGLCFLHTRTHQVMSLGLRGPRGYKNISGFGVRLGILELGIGPILFPSYPRISSLQSSQVEDSWLWVSLTWGHIRVIREVRKTQHQNPELVINRVRLRINLQKSTFKGVKPKKPSIFVINWVSSCLSFFLSAFTAATYIFTAPTCTTPIITLEHCAFHTEI